MELDNHSLVEEKEEEKDMLVEEEKGGSIKELVKNEVTES